MKVSVPKEFNRQNFLDAYQVLKHFDAFPFFGTLLGFVRNNDIIDGDDDVDFYVDSKFSQAVKDALTARGFEYATALEEVSSGNFMQFQKQLQGVNTYVDIYLFETTDDEGFIIDKWNFLGRPDNFSCHLKVDKQLLFPLVEVRMLGEMIALPSNPEGCCEFLYGRSWRTPKLKSAEYVALIHHNKPIVFERDDYIFKLLKERVELEAWCAELSTVRDWWRQQFESTREHYAQATANFASQSEWLDSVQEGKDWLEKQWQQSLAIIEEQKTLVAVLEETIRKGQSTRLPEE